MGRRPDRRGIDHGQHPAGLDLVALGHVHLGHRPRRGGVHGVLHLHGLEHHQHLAGDHHVALGHVDPHHGAWHRGERRALAQPLVGRREADPLVGGSSSRRDRPRRRPVRSSRRGSAGSPPRRSGRPRRALPSPPRRPPARRPPRRGPAPGRSGRSGRRRVRSVPPHSKVTCWGRNGLLRKPEGTARWTRAPRRRPAWAARAAATVWRTTAASSARGADSRSSPCRSRKPVSVCPATKAGWRTVRTSRSRLVVTPWMRARARAPARAAAASDRVGPVGDDLGQHGVVVRADHRSRLDSAVHPDRSSLVADLEPVQPPGRGQPVAGRVLGVEPGLDRMAAGTRSPPPRAPRRGRAAPAATRSCNRTRSSPVTASVTGCSTCSRVFISRKNGSPFRSTTNSTVPALT